MVTDPKGRFAGKGTVYIKARKGYDQTLIDKFESALGLTPEASLADVGAGPGTLGIAFAEKGYKVSMIEPQESMRIEAEKALKALQRDNTVGLSSVVINGDAIGTKLEPTSVDGVVAGTAIHWFPYQESLAEFNRILKPGGRIGAIYTGILDKNSGKGKDLEEFLGNKSPEYQEYQRYFFWQNGMEAVSRLFIEEDKVAHQEGVPKNRTFNKKEFLQWSLARSFVPQEAKKKTELMVHLGKFFDEHNVDGNLTLTFNSGFDVGPLRKTEVMPNIPGPTAPWEEGVQR